jgi:superoxide dismutase, Fe-Mn family
VTLESHCSRHRQMLHVCAGKTAILTMDVWEHAYYLDFQNVRPGYINTYIDNLIDWGKIADRYAAATA